MIGLTGRNEFDPRPDNPLYTSSPASTSQIMAMAGRRLWMKSRRWTIQMRWSEILTNQKLLLFIPYGFLAQNLPGKEKQNHDAMHLSIWNFAF